jgi:hypothetical protein
MQQQYWVYENWTHDRARVHKSECTFCNDGRGVHAEVIDKRNGTWHGPYADRAAAFNDAVKTGRASNRGCAVCDP